MYDRNVLKNNTIFCSNCGKYNHLSKQCYQPVISLGMIVYKKIGNKILYLMIRRRNTIGFVELIRGRYAQHDVDYIQKLINVLTVDELNLLKSKPFNELWETIWYDNFFNKHTTKTLQDMKNAEDKFNKLKEGFIINDKLIKLDDLLTNKVSTYLEQEWGFPKGRRKNRENNFQTALREFNEETNIKINNLIFDSRKHYFSEEYKSYDNLIYKNIYYLAEYTGNINIDISEDNRFQFPEVSGINFMDLPTCIEKFRDYEHDRRELLIKVHSYVVNGNLL